MWIGAHVATGDRGTLMGAIDRARAIGADCGQIWASNPRAWAPPLTSPEAARAFGEAWRSAGLGPLVLHCPYVVNVASPNAGFRSRSVDLAKATVALAERMGAHGVVVHSGAAGASTAREAALRVAADSFRRIADAASATWVLVELMAGTAGSVASTLPQARELFDACGMHERLALCLDLCHLFASGYALDEPDGVDRCFAELRSAALASRVRCIHGNDSKHGRGLRRDSHEHVGDGLIGERGFAQILRESVVRRCPVIVETAGEDADRARDVATLRRLAETG